MSRRYRTNHPNVRSTTHRRGWTLNPSAAFRVIVTAHRHTRRTNSTNRLLKALSAITSRTRGSSRRPAAPRGAGPRLGEERFDPLPLLIREVGRVWLACHARQV